MTLIFKKLPVVMYRKIWTDAHYKISEPMTLSETMNDQQFYYETKYILRPDIAEDEVINHIDKYNKLLEKFGGTILDSQMRGKRRLAYQIAKHREGIYVQPVSYTHLRAHET